MSSRFPSRPAGATGRLALVLSVVGVGFALSGCGDAFHPGPLSYVESEKLEASSDLKDKPELKQAVRKAVAHLFGPDPQHIKVPEGSGFPNGGLALANLRDDGKGRLTPVVLTPPGGSKADAVPVEGGYALYRKHCLHCHGVSGAGDGPTGAFLFPRPRDYRKGVYKFTSTPTGAKPTRDDLRRTIRYGLHGTSMPAFEAFMTEDAIDQVIDYMTFLGMRGETELALIDEAGATGELADETVTDVAKTVFDKWRTVDDQVMNPPVARTPPTPESVKRGQELFLGRNATGNKVDCTSCHGPRGQGDGPSFVSREVFDSVVFGSGRPLTRFLLTPGQLSVLQAVTDLDAAHAKDKAKPDATPANVAGAVLRDLGLTDKDDLATVKGKAGYDEAALGPAGTPTEVVEAMVRDLEEKTLVSHAFGFGGVPYRAAIDRKTGELWNNSLDDWGTPLRPADLNKGVYKGGRRPIDLYWRIAKGINGAKMPAHYPTVEPERIWDLVNFILALPDDKALLDGADRPESAPAATPAVARR